MSGYVCSDTVFNLSHRVLSVTHVKVLEKCLDYALIQKKINEPELMAAFVSFAGVWEIRGFFGMNQLLNLVFRVRFSWKAPNGHPALDS